MNIGHMTRLDIEEDDILVISSPHTMEKDVADMIAEQFKSLGINNEIIFVTEGTTVSALGRIPPDDEDLPHAPPPGYK